MIKYILIFLILSGCSASQPKNISSNNSHHNNTKYYLVNDIILKNNSDYTFRDVNVVTLPNERILLNCLYILSNTEYRKTFKTKTRVGEIIALTWKQGLRTNSSGVITINTEKSSTQNKIIFEITEDRTFSAYFTD